MATRSPTAREKRLALRVGLTLTSRYGIWSARNGAGEVVFVIDGQIETWTTFRIFLAEVLDADEPFRF